MSVAVGWVVVEADGWRSCVCELLVLGVLADDDGVRIVSSGPARHVHPSRKGMWFRSGSYLCTAEVVGLRSEIDCAGLGVC